jgi:hypothetical protein
MGSQHRPSWLGVARGYRDASKSSHGQRGDWPAKAPKPVESQSATAPAGEPAHYAQSTNVDGAGV